METLEQRRLLTVGVPEWDYSAMDALSPAGEPIYIRLDGTNGPDHYSADSASGNVQFFNNDLATPNLGTFTLGEISSFIGIVNLLEEMNGGAGNNFYAGVQMNGNGGDDILDASNLTLYPAWLTGGDGNDTLSASAKDDVLEGGDGNDTLTSGAGDDILQGGVGNDILLGGIGNDMMRGGAGDDSLDGAEGADILEGEDDNDILNGGADDDTLSGGAGNDTLDGGAGADQLDGGLNDDILYTDGFGITAGIQYDAKLSGGDGVDELVVAGPGAFVAYLNADMEIIPGSDLDDQIDSSTYAGPGADAGAGITGVIVHGKAGDDSIIGSSHHDRLYGDDGDDSMVGGLGDDLLDGGIGGDFLEGGLGADQIYGGDGTDTASYENSGPVNVDLNTDDGLDSDGAGVDREFSQGGEAEGDSFPGPAQGYPRTADVENLIGSAGDDVLAGDLGPNLIQGLAGNDTIRGNEGNDTLEGSAGGDSIVGEGGDDEIVGGSGNDTLDGGAGIDFLDGEVGDDTLVGGTGVDYLFGGAGNDDLNGGSSGDISDEAADYLYGEDGTDTLRVEFSTADPMVPPLAEIVDAYVFGGFDSDLFIIDGVLGGTRIQIGLKKIGAKQQLTSRSLLSEMDFGFGDVDRVSFG